MNQDVSSLFLSHKINANAPKKIAMSATLNENGFLMPQQLIFKKSATAPKTILSVALPIAPPIIRATQICRNVFLLFLTHQNNATEIAIDKKINTMLIKPVKINH